MHSPLLQGSHMSESIGNSSCERQLKILRNMQWYPLFPLASKACMLPFSLFNAS